VEKPNPLERHQTCLWKADFEERRCASPVSATPSSFVVQQLHPTYLLRGKDLRQGGMAGGCLLKKENIVLNTSNVTIQHCFPLEIDKFVKKSDSAAPLKFSS